MMNTKNLAVAILMSLGVTACSVGSGNGSSGNPVENPKSTTATTSATTAATPTTEKTAEQKAAEQKAEDEAAAKEAEDKKAAADAAAKLAEEQKAAADAAAKLAEEQKTAEAEAAAKKAAEEAAAAAEAARIAAEEAAKQAAELAKVNAVKKVASTYFADKTESYTYQYLVTEEGKAKFAEALKTAPVTIANCSTGSVKNPSICSKSTAPGTILAKSESAYGGYAVIRETYSTDDKGTETTTDDTNNADLGIPTNSFIYYVNTPTTSKSLVTNATYKGQVSYSRKNAPGVVTSTRLELTVEGDTLTGLVDEVTNSGKIRPTMKFENGVISEQDNTVVVNGETTFLYADGSGFDNAKKEDFKGTFKGQFAGDSAQQVVGTFESTSTEKDQSVQGAFSATK